MESELLQIREQQKESWNRFSPGWKKWDTLFMDFLRPMGHEIIERLDPKEMDIVLDVATGTGEPGLSIATRLRGGLVVLTDLAEDMLDIARGNALRRGIETVETRACDVCELPFSANTFDAISCRFGFMFFPDMTLAAEEMVRVLRPGGKIATSVWSGPEKNCWITAMMNAIHKYMEVTAPPPGAPGMFRCANDGLMVDLFSNAGLRNISFKEVSSKLNCQTVDIYWELMTELAAPVVAALSKADAVTREKIRQEVHRTVIERYPDGNVQMNASALVVYGEK